MRRVLIMTLMGVLVCAAVDARRPRDRAGKIKDGVYEDKTHGFQLKLNPDWKTKIGDNDKHYRLTLSQNSWEPPPHYADAKDYTKIPRTVVYADTTSLSVSDFIDSLMSETYESKQKKEIFKEFEILNKQSGGSGMTREDLVPRQRKPMDLAGERGYFWSGKVKYRNEIATTMTSAGGRRVYGGYYGCIIGVKKDKTIILLHTICEEEFAEVVTQEALRLASSLEWAK
ncbi:MAG: hypothetical protein JSV52_01535 [Candidatus Zixiibacteriota bacterium]|nr:MAG: hypothetical protein JSV52_01535 [candidate division Zixibacteria bacterium]